MVTYTGTTSGKAFVDVPIMQGATASAAGAAGLVPAPASGEHNKLLTGAGTYVSVSGAGGVSDHGALTGLGDNDHPKYSGYYYFKVDGSYGDGTTDATTAINDAFAAVRSAQSTAIASNGIVIGLEFDPGTYLITDSINATGIRAFNFHLRGNGAVILAKCAGKPAFDMLNSRFWTMDSPLMIYGVQTDTPTYGVQQGMISAANCGDSTLMFNMDGYFSVACHYNYSAETVTYIHPRWYNKSTAANSYVNIMDGGNFQNIISSFVTQTNAVGQARSFNEQKFLQPDFRKENGGRTMKWMGRTLRRHNYDNGYGVAVNDAFIETYNTPTLADIDCDIHVETNGCTKYLLIDNVTPSANVEVYGLRIHDQAPQCSTCIIDTTGSAQIVNLTGCTLDVGDPLSTIPLFGSTSQPSKIQASGTIKWMSSKTLDMSKAYFNGEVIAHASGAITDSNAALSGTSSYKLTRLPSSTNNRKNNFVGDGIFTGPLAASNFSGSSSNTNTGDISISGESYLSLSGQAVSAKAISLTSNVSGNLPVARLNGGTTASAGTFWRGDGAWATPPGLDAGDLSNTSDVAKGDALCGVKLNRTGGVARTQHDKNADFINVGDYGSLDLTGVADVSTVFQAARDASVSNEAIFVPAGKHKLTVGVSGGSNLWIAHGATNPAGSDTPNLPGVVMGQFSNRLRMERRKGSTDNDYSTLEVVRRAEHTSGSTTNVNSSGIFHTIVSSSVPNNEWALIGKVHSKGTGQNVGVFGQGWRQGGSGHIWGMVGDAEDFTGAESSGAVIGAEFDCFASGGNSAFHNRIGTMIVAGTPHGVSAANSQTWFGLYVTSENGTNKGYYKHGVHVGNDESKGQARMTSDIGVKVLADGSYGYWDEGSKTEAFRAVGSYSGAITYAENNSDLGVAVSANKLMFDYRQKTGVHQSTIKMDHLRVVSANDWTGTHARIYRDVGGVKMGSFEFRSLDDIAFNRSLAITMDGTDFYEANLLRGASVLNKPLILNEQVSAPLSNPANGTEAQLYIKGDKFIIQWNDAGTQRWKYLTLSGTGTTFTHTTVAP